MLQNTFKKDKTFLRDHQPVIGINKDQIVPTFSRSEAVNSIILRFSPLKPRADGTFLFWFICADLWHITFAYDN